MHGGRYEAGSLAPEQQQDRLWASALGTIARMGILYLGRHGQASLGAADYDQLSPRGQAQALRLGEYWRAQGQTFDAVITGTLRRHRQTLAGIAQGPQTRTPQPFRLLCAALAQWMAGTISPPGMPRWSAFSAGVHAALTHVRQQHAGQNV